MKLLSDTQLNKLSRRLVGLVESVAAKELERQGAVFKEKSLR